MSPTDQLRVLVVDDDEDDHLLIEDLMEEGGAPYLLRQAYTGAEALTAIDSEPIDVILVDYRLGAEDGLDVIRRLDERGFEGPMILLTGQDDLELGRLALREGATDYLVKGRFSSDGLVRTIRFGAERRTLERRLKQFNVQLEDRVRERTQELELATRELEGFTYSASHDLRTPLRAIMGTSRILLEDYADLLPPEGKALLEKQSGAAGRLGQLIDDLLELSRIGRYEIRRDPVDLGELVKTFAEGMHRPITVTVAGSTVVEGDPRLLSLVAQNLVENSVKFTPADQTVNVLVRGAREADQAVVSYEDDGPGFDQRYEPKIWQPFQRLVRDDEYPGTGIGLANVKRIVDRHGAKVRAEGRLGLGARFVFEFPISRIDQ